MIKILQGNTKNTQKPCKKMTKPRTINTSQEHLFRNRLSTQLNQQHSLMQLTHLINWTALEKDFAELFPSTIGHPPLPIRLVVGILMLQHINGLSDEEVVKKWVENPYYQYFCGYDHFQWNLPLDPTSLVRWRKRLGTSGMDKILQSSIRAASACGLVKPSSLKQVIADTTVQEKAIAHPTDARLLNRARQKLVDLAKEQGIVLRQTYRLVAKHCAIKVGRYAHAKQFKRLGKKVKELKNYLGRVVRDIERKVGTDQVFQDLLEKSRRLLSQGKHTSKKLYSLHAPEAECIAKGKARTPYEFGCKVALVLTHREGLVLSSDALHGNPYDGHTLEGSLAHATKMSGVKIDQVFVDKGYKKHGVEGAEVLMSGQRKLSASLKRALKRRSAIEPHIGHMKADGKLGRNHLKGVLGDRINALLTGVGHNFRLILNHLGSIFAFFVACIFDMLEKQAKLRNKILLLSF